ncbi:hypothetical protein Droror1_Dr00020447 [Drosera rotundifolia]
MIPQCQSEIALRGDPPHGQDKFVVVEGGFAFALDLGEELRKLIGAPAFIECSSKTQQNVKAVFDQAIKVVLQPPK